LIRNDQERGRHTSSTPHEKKGKMRLKQKPKIPAQVQRDERKKKLRGKEKKEVTIRILSLVQTKTP